MAKMLSREAISSASIAVEREEFELACVREFSHSGLQLGAGVSRVERRERIRAAILRENKAHLLWRDTGMTYAEAYRRAYHESLGESLVTTKQDKGAPLPAQLSLKTGGFEDDEEDDPTDEEFLPASDDHESMVNFH